MDGDFNKKEKDDLCWCNAFSHLLYEFPLQVCWAKLFNHNLLLKPSWAWSWIYFKIILINLNKCYLLNIVFFICAVEFLKM